MPFSISKHVLHSLVAIFLHSESQQQCMYLSDHFFCSQTNGSLALTQQYRLLLDFLPPKLTLIPCKLLIFFVTSLFHPDLVPVAVSLGSFFTCSSITRWPLPWGLLPHLSTLDTAQVKSNKYVSRVRGWKRGKV